MLPAGCIAPVDVYKRQIPILHSFAPNGDIKHLHHPLFDIRKGCKIHIIQTRKNIQKERNPAARIDHSKLCKRFGQDILQRLRKVLDGIRSGANAREGRKLINRSRIKMAVIQEIFECQLQTTVFRERCYAGYQAGGIAIGCADVIQYVLCGFFLQLDRCV